MLAVVQLHKASSPTPDDIQAEKATQGEALIITTAPRDFVYIVLNSDSAQALSLIIRGLEKESKMPSSLIFAASS